MPAREHAGYGRQRGLVLVAVLALALSGALVGSLSGNASAAQARARCSYPEGVTPGVWSLLPSPTGSVLSSVAQLDSDPCQLVGVGSPGLVGAGQAWRSSDAGAHWTAQADTRQLDQVFTERLTKRVGPRWLGPVLATGPTTVTAGVALDAVDQVYVSQDGGRRFSPSLEVVSAGTAPLHGRLLSAATAITYTGGSPRPDVYVATAPAMAPPGPGVPAQPVGYRLLKSTDGGATFAALPTGAGLAPSVVDVSPSNPDEVWVNNAHTGSAGGGAFVSRDGGTTWSLGCLCATANVSDVAVMAAATSTTVYLATDQGLLVSEDDGASWKTLTSAATQQVRTAPDDPRVVLSVSDGKVALWRGLAAAPAPTPGLPADCAPSQLRRDSIVPATFLVTCASGSTYRLLLDDYGHDGKPAPGPTAPGVPVFPGTDDPLTGVPIKELATWTLPGANPASGAVAFDGRSLYYDDFAGRIALVRAGDGHFAGYLPVAQSSPPVGLTVDLRRNQLLVTDVAGELFAYGLASHRRTHLSAAPYKVVSFDASFGGLSWVPEKGDTIERVSRTGGPYGVRTLCSGAADGLEPSTFVADGAGGGYVQDEDDKTLYRVNSRCAKTGPFYQHRQFSESGAENDAMACDAQTFFPQAAIWIRDSQPGTVTAYGVPYAYCPMPSELAIGAARAMSSGTLTNVCAVLTNMTTGVPVPDRAVSIAVGGVVLGNRLTDSAGRVCLPYLTPVVGASGLTLPVRAVFAGDPALYGSTAVSTLVVVNAPPPAAHDLLPAVPPPAGYAPPPPNPIVNPPGQPVHAPGPGPNVAQAQQGQAQAQAQGGLQAAVVPQPHKQQQLALVTAAQQINAQATGEHAMSALHPRHRHGPHWSSPLLVLAGVVSCGLAGALSRGRQQFSSPRARP